MGTLLEAPSSLSSAFAKPRLCPAMAAPVLSARYSRDCETAICTSMAAIGPKMIKGKDASKPPPFS